MGSVVLSVTNASVVSAERWGSTVLSLGSCLMYHHTARGARQAFFTIGTPNLFGFLASALELVTARSWSVHKTSRVLEQTSSGFTGRMQFCALNLTGGNLGVSGTAVSCPLGMEVCCAQIGGQVIITSVLCTEYDRTL